MILERPRSLLPHLHLASETSGGWKRGLAVSFLEPHGRVGAEIVCDDTLVQYAAYLALLSSIGGEWMVSFDSDHSGGDGASPFFFSGQFFNDTPLVPGECWKDFFFWRPC